jgi:hypothetical protein
MDDCAPRGRPQRRAEPAPAAAAGAPASVAAFLSYQHIRPAGVRVIRRPFHSNPATRNGAVTGPVGDGYLVAYE